VNKTIIPHLGDIFLIIQFSNVILDKSEKEYKNLHPGLYTSKEELDEATPALPYAHTVRRAWQAMNLSGVLYTNRTPTAVFKKDTGLSDSEVCRLHRQLWNLAIIPVLVLYNDTQIKVYSAWARPAKKGDKPDDNHRRVETLEETILLVELIQKIETGSFITEHPKSFDRTQAVDYYLIDNLQAVAQKMIALNGDHFQKESIHRFLLRILFVSYLIERKIVCGTSFSSKDSSLLCKLSPTYTLENLIDECSSDLIKARDIIFRLFLKIKGTFNGSLLDKDMEAEKEIITPEHMQYLHAFLRGTKISNGQMVLGFWAYDFSLIPIETISAIYERFLEEGELREDSGIYYTPPHLAELVVDIVTEKLRKPLYECRVLDPACGSGVFLVVLFNRMAEEWQRANQNRQLKTRARELKDIIQNQLVGLDKHELPCFISCFSLYLAYLDQLYPKDIEYLKENNIKLPPLVLGKEEDQPVSEKRTLICRNFFDKNLPLPIERFDIIIGNPPWVSRKSSDESFKEWIKCSDKPKNVLAPQDQIAHGFLWRTLDFLDENGQACLLMPTTVLLNKTDAFQEKWFQTATVDRVVNFADLRRFLFPGAIHPSVAIRFSKEVPDISKHSIIYETPKAERRTQKGGPVYLYDEDRSVIRLTELLAEADNKIKNASVVWKSRLWGTGRDRRLLQRMSDMPRLEDIVGTPEKPKLLIKGQGFKPQREPLDNKKAWWSKKDLFIDANKDFSLILLPNDCKAVGNKYEILHRLPAKELFLNPKVLVSRGATDMKVAFADFPVLFRYSLQSIAGSQDDTKLLLFLTIVLKSRLIQYYLFHTSSSLGIERDLVLFEELLRIPFLLPQDTANPVRSQEIIDIIASKLKKFKINLQINEYALGRSECAEQIQKDCEALVREYYDIDEYETMLIDDTLNIFKNSATPTANKSEVKTLGPAKSKDCLGYTETLCRLFNEFSSSSSYQIRGEVILPKQGNDFALVTLKQTKGKEKNLATVKEGNPDLITLLNRFAKSLPHAKRNFVYYRNLKIFDGNQIHIIKPLALRSWTKTAALNDADEIAGAILGGMKGN
jgi:hypothetical protein